MSSALMVGAMMSGGCNIVGPIAYAIEGPPKHLKVADLDADRRTVILLDDRASQLPKRALRRDICEAAEEEMLRKKTVKQGNLISWAAAQRVVQNESDASPMGVVDVGREVRAEVVVYCVVKEFTLSRDGASIAPYMQFEVKIVDTVANRRLWPPTTDGYPLSIRLQSRPGFVQDLSLTERAAIEKFMAQAAGLRISRMFYDSERDPSIGTGALR